MFFVTRFGMEITSLYLRFGPSSWGRWRLINYYLPKLRQMGAQLGERTVKTRHGFRMKINLGDWLGQYVWLTGNYEPSTASIMAALLKPGNTMVDIGANAGFFTLLAARHVGQRGLVHAFEPIPSTYNRLVHNIALNQTTHVTSYPIAISATKGEITIYEGPADHVGLSGMRKLAQTKTTHQVITSPLDEIISKNAPIHLIKIDVEGAEQLVIEGMTHILTMHHPHLIIEFSDNFLRDFGHSADSLYSIIVKQGYEVYQITEQGLVHIPESLAEWPQQFNALCTVMEKLPS